MSNSSDTLSDGAIYAAISDKLQLKEMAAKDAEINRLRTALQKITEVEPSYDYGWGCECQDIANEALVNHKSSEA